MQALFNFFMLLMMLLSSGCQLLKWPPTLFNNAPPAKVQQHIPEKTQLISLLEQSAKLTELNPQQQAAACPRLKNAYAKQASWETAWLLVYALNIDFKCMPLNKTLALLNEMQTLLIPFPELQWLNKSKTNTLKTIKSLQTSNIRNKKRLKTKTRRLKQSQLELEATQNQLKEMQDKIQALKAIETRINKKTK